MAAGSRLDMAVAAGSRLDTAVAAGSRLYNGGSAHIYPVRAQRAGNRFRIIALANCYVQQQQQQQQQQHQEVHGVDEPELLEEADSETLSKRDISCESDRWQCGQTKSKINHINDNQSTIVPLPMQHEVLGDHCDSDRSEERSAVAISRSRLPYGPRPIPKSYRIGANSE
jgi:hypothetical protein